MSGMHRNSVENPKVKKQSKIRLAVQAGFAVFLNGYLKGFFKGEIFDGKTKTVCVPVLNWRICND